MATNPRFYGNLLWTHIKQRDDMRFVFDDMVTQHPNGLVSTKRCIKVMAGGDVLEQVSFEELMNQARLDQDRALSQTIPDAECYMAILVKSPLIAVRYRLPDGKVRRFQTAFRSTSDYSVSVKMLASYGLPIRYKDVSQLPAPAQISYTSQMPMIYQPQQNLNSGLSQSVQSFGSQGSSSQAPVAKMVTPAPTPLSGGVTAQNILAIGNNTTKGPEMSILPSLAAGPRLNLSLHSLPVNQSEIPSMNSLTPRTHTSDGYFGDSTRRLLFAQELAARPSSAPEASQSDSITQLLPPKRVLPFPSPTKKRVLKEPVEVEETAEPSKKKSRKKSVVAELKATPTDQIVFKVPEVPTRAAKARHARTTGSALANTLEPIKIPTKPTASKTTWRLQKSKDADSDEPVAEGVATRAAPKKSGQRVGTPEGDQEEISKEYQKDVDTFIKRYAPPKNSALEIFAALHEDERAAQVDAMLREFIFDDNFVIYCEELEKSLARNGVVL
ncbi:MAG: hypothetical protein MMC33_006627 [Icmadophila ericetorum]|nr:hypothetical protein [Icmadophila ericetorum]